MSDVTSLPTFTTRFSNPNAWRKTFKPSKHWLTPCLTALPSNLWPTTPHAISYFFTSDRTIQKLNKTYRGKDAPTNVLSFPLDLDVPSEEGKPLGDVIIALETMVRESQQFERPFEHHLAHMVMHGTLHLLGFDHQTLDEQAEMQAIEVTALARLAIPNPYDR